MGMDVYGRKPKSEVGKYFRNNVWWWHPLWDYCCEVAPDLIGEELAQAGHFNDGAGLRATSALKLAERLEENIESGHTEQYAAQYKNDTYGFSVENVREFAAFLRDSGGFRIH